MPGITFHSAAAGAVAVPNRRRFQLANSMTGTGTPPAAQLQAGDLVVLTTKSTLTANGVVVCRMLVQPDVTASYQESSANAGVLGICTSTVDTNASGLAIGTSTPGSGNVIYALPSESAGWIADPTTGRSYIDVIVADDNMVFKGKLNTGTAGEADINTQAGFNLSTTSGVTTYTVQKSASVKTVTIIGYDPNDTTYVYFKVLPAYQQNSTGVNYSTN